MATDIQGRYFFFGDFRLDFRSGELQGKGREIRLQPQPAKLLVLLATHRGEIVTRGEIQKALWGDDTFVDFEHGINFSIKQIREALGDSAEKPRFVETVPRIGYRFIAAAESEVAPANLPARRQWKSLAIAASAAIIGVGVLAFSALRSKSPPANLRMPRFQLSLPGGVRIPPVTAETVVAISPDGSKMAFVGCGSDGLCRLYLRDQSDIDALPIPGTDGAGCPFFSPDGRWIAFGANGKMKKVDLDHGAVVFFADAPQFRGGSWGQDGTILFSRGLGGILRVSAEGGEVQEVTTPDPERHEHDHRWPHVLPGGRAALFDVLYDHANNAVGSRGHDIALVNLETGRKRILVESAGCPKYMSGHLLFGRNGVVYAGRFDIERLELLSAPVPALEDVAMWSSPGTRANSSGNVQYDFARKETLLFSPREARLPKEDSCSWIEKVDRRRSRDRSELTANRGSLLTDRASRLRSTSTGSEGPSSSTLHPTPGRGWKAMTSYRMRGCRTVSAFSFAVFGPGITHCFSRPSMGARQQPRDALHWKVGTSDRCPGRELGSLRRRSRSLGVGPLASDAHGPGRCRALARDAGQRRGDELLP